MLEIEKLKFKNPKSEYRVAPFWFWNHELKKDEIRWQIQEMNRQGVGGFIMHGRCGLMTPYMSDEWLAICETAIKEAEQLGMKVYLYDENDFISGTANSRVTENPEFRMTGLVISQERYIKGPNHIEMEIKIVDGLVGVLALPLMGRRITNFPDGVINLHASVKDNRLIWKVPMGKWLVIVFVKKVWHEGYNLYALDFMNPKAVARFIELTHEQYRKRFGRYFGKVINGIFTDEPAVTYVEPGIPWTKSLPKEFLKEHGYELTTVLPALFKETGSKSVKFRCDYWETITRLYSEKFFKQVWKFCDSCNLNSVGHVSSEDQLYLQARREGDFFRCGKWMHFGGCDYLSSRTWPGTPKGAVDFSFGGMNNLLSPKFASSTAHLYEKPRVMSEAFGHAGQWAVNFRTLKKIADWQVALGVNLLMPHTFYYTILTFRKWESPPGEFYQSPFWQYYKTFADYCGRLCSIFSGGLHMANVAVLYPIKSMWASNISLQEPPSKKADRVVLGLTKVTKALLRRHHDFDIIPEELLQEARVFDSIKICGSRGKCLHEFKVLVIPFSTTLSNKTLDKIKEFYTHGGRVILTGMLPDSTSEKGEDRYPAEIFQSIFGKRIGCKTPIFISNKNGGKAVWLPELELKSEGMIEKLLVKALEPEIEPQVRIIENGSSVGDIICLRYHKAGIDYYFLVNTSTEKRFITQTTLSSVGRLNLWDAKTGEVKEIQGYKTKSDKTVLEDMSFEPTQSYIISVSRGSKSDSKSVVRLKNPEERIILTLPDRWYFSADKPNALPLTNWSMALESGLGLPSMFGEVNPDFCDGIRRYQTEFYLETKPSKAKLLFDGLIGEHHLRPYPARFTYTVILNRHEVKDFQKGQYIDHLMMEAEIGHLLKQGSNELIVRTKQEIYDKGNLGHPPLLLGNFCLKQRDGKWRVTSPIKGSVKGSWTEFGYPFYSGIGTYTQVAELPKHGKDERFFLRFEKVGDLAEVIISGSSVGVTAWEPFEVDITNHIKQGKNRIEIKVANSLQNLLVLTPKASGILGKIEVIARKEH